MKRILCVTEYRGILSSYLLEDGVLAELRPIEEGSELGKITVAVVEKVLPSISAAFLQIKGNAPLYYPLNENDGRHIFIRHGKKEKLSPGDTLLVQIQREPIKNKLALASADITLTGDTVIVNRTGVCGISSKISDPETKHKLSAMGKELLKSEGAEDAGLIFRTVSADVEEKTVREETIKLLCKQKEIIDAAMHATPGSVLYEKEPAILSELHSLRVKHPEDELLFVTDSRDVFERMQMHIDSDLKNIEIKLHEDDNLSLTSLYDLVRQADKALERTVNLKSGGNLVIEPTEALTVIDVNTAKAIRGHSMEETFRKINREAAKMAARLIRLRNLSGIILIDFINMKKEEDTEELISFLKEELAKDPGRAVFHDMTKLGLCEITRKKVSPPLHEIYR